jgi:hypothetical protein
MCASSRARTEPTDVIIDVIEDALWIDPLAKANGDMGFEMTIAAAVPSGRPAATRLNRG